VAPLSVCALILGVALHPMAPVGAADAQQETLDAQRDFNAVQVVYRAGVPHTDKRGQVLMQYDPARSFLQIGIWGIPPPCEVYGHKYDWEPLKAAGINAVWPWFRDEDVLPICEREGMQAVLMHPHDPDFWRQWKDHPALLGNCWMDEPLGRWDKQQETFDEYTQYREATRQVAPQLPIFINQVPWIMAPATGWWGKWNEASDISCHDNYPIMHRRTRPASLSADPNGIAQSVSFAVGCSREQKPVWLIVGAFTDCQPPGAAFPFRFPSPIELRACVYTGLIHGATGIIYFTWDTWIPRDGGVIGMTHDPQVAWAPLPKAEGCTNPSPATPMQMVQSRACWEAAVQINRELAELAPVILAPTIGTAAGYGVRIEGSAPTPTPIRCLLKPHPEGGYVLLTVNCDDAVLKVTHSFGQSLASAQTLYENRDPLPLGADGKSFTLMYEPFDTHVIRVRPAE